MIGIQALHSPTLKTVLLVEDILKAAKQPLSRYEILKRTHNTIMRTTLNTIIQYLEERYMVLDTEKGIVWVYTPPEKMKRLLSSSVKV